MGIPIFKIRRPRDRLIFNMGIHTLVRWHLYIETAHLVAVGLPVGTGKIWSLIGWHHPLLTGQNIGWDCLLCNGLWAHVTSGNFHHFSKATESSLAQTQDNLFAVSAVQRDCERVYGRGDSVEPQGAAQHWETLQAISKYGCQWQCYMETEPDSIFKHHLSRYRNSHYKHQMVGRIGPILRVLYWEVILYIM